jgi:lysophospholipase L1-like esterase
MIAKSSIGAVPLAALVLGASIAGRAAAEEGSECRAEVWAEAIAAFAKEDEKEAPPTEGILFVGSSSIRMWDLKKSFPDLPAINRGFGGSQICDAVHYADELVVKHRPKVVVFYSGDNDIAAGKSPEQVQRDFRAFLDKVRKPLSEVRIVFVSIKPSIARWKLADKMREANRLIREDIAEDKQVVFVDVWVEMLGEDGMPRKELLRDDGLHLNEAGYETWTKLVRPHLDEKK